MIKVVLTTTLPESPFAALGFFRKEAIAQGWDKEEVRDFVNTALSADHLHLVKLIEEHSERKVTNGL